MQHSAARKSYTLDDIGDEEGLTRERIRQIQNEALRKMRESMERDGLDISQLKFV